MQLKLSEIRAAARRDLFGKWSKASLLFLVFSLLCLPFNLFICQYGFWGGLTMLVFVFFLYLLLRWGYLISYLTNSRGYDSPFAISSLFTGFGDYVRITFTLCIKELYILLWMLALLVPYLAIIIYIGGGIDFEKIGAFIDEFLVIDLFYRFIGYIVESCGNLANYIVWTCFSIPFIIILLPGCTLAIIKSLSYSMTPYILHDYKNLKNNDAIELSMKMMDGHKKQLLCLYLSFLGWGIICLMTMFIGILWLSPYINASLIKFYEQVKDEYEQKCLN